jgi:hypothetical protein
MQFCPEGRTAMQVFDCEHKACLLCERRIRVQGILVYEVCGSTLVLHKLDKQFQIRVTTIHTCSVDHFNANSEVKADASENCRV